MLDAEEATQQARAVVTRDAGCQVDSDGDVVMAAGQSEGNVSSNWSELSWSVSLAIVRPATALRVLVRGSWAGVLADAAARRWCRASRACDAWLGRWLGRACLTWHLEPVSRRRWQCGGRGRGVFVCEWVCVWVACKCRCGTPLGVCSWRWKRCVSLTTTHQRTLPRALLRDTCNSSCPC